MEPLLKEHSVVLVSSIPYFFSSPQKGDVVVFNDNKTGKVFLKRIKEIKKNKYFASGDNKKDSLYIGWIERKDIIGKVIYGY